MNKNSNNLEELSKHYCLNILKNKTLITLINTISVVFKFYIEISFYFSLVCFVTLLSNYYGLIAIIFLLSDYYIWNTYNISILYQLKKFKDYILFSIHILFIINKVISGLHTNSIEIYCITIFCLNIIIISMIILVYINLIDKRFKVKYPYLYTLLNISLIVIVTISLYIVLMNNGRPTGSPMPNGHRGVSGGSGRPPGPPRGQNGVGLSLGHNPRDSQSNPTQPSRYPGWDGTELDGGDRPLTPEPPHHVATRLPLTRSPSPQGPVGSWLNLRNQFYITRAPDMFYRRHWEGRFIYLNRPPVEGDTFTWINSRYEWVPARLGVWVNRDFIYSDGEWRWQAVRVCYDHTRRSYLRRL